MTVLHSEEQQRLLVDLVFDERREATGLDLDPTETAHRLVALYAGLGIPESFNADLVDILEALEIRAAAEIGVPDLFMVENVRPIVDLAKRRRAAREAHNFELADHLRSKIQSYGLDVVDLAAA